MEHVWVVVLPPQRCSASPCAWNSPHEWTELHGALPQRAAGVEGNPSGKWEKSELLEEATKGMDTGIPRTIFPCAVQ